MNHAIVVCPDIKADHRHQRRSISARLGEAISLTQAIGLEVMHAQAVPVQTVRPATVIGSGQIEQIAQRISEEEHPISVVIFDTALTPMQQRNLEKQLSTKVIDRSALILEIFGERARTKEGRLQVELAALEYQKSRLVRSWTHLERQRGGYGFMGGPGESQIETDRRLIRDRIAVIKKQLEKVVRTRSLHRHVRDSVPYPTVALVGYTNAGKSTLFNRLTSASVLAQDALFATLDPTTRKVRLPSGPEILLSDTVGFISDLPTQLIAAFRATLEEVRQADILLHVRDITHPDTKAQRDDVLDVIGSLFDTPETIPPIIEVWNKCDQADAMQQENLAIYTQNPVAVSAITGYGIGHLLTSIAETLSSTLYCPVRYALDVTHGEALAWLHQHGVVERETASQDALSIVLEVALSPADKERFQQRFGIVPQETQEALL